MTKQRFDVLDSFRGLCALCVVVHHMHWSGSFTELDFFRGSDLFVEFFFVLSGFVLAHGYAYRENLAFRPYLRSRFFRLFPLHVFMLLVFVAMEGGKWVAQQRFGLHFNNEAFSNTYAPSEFLPNLLLIHAWTPWTHALSFNTPAWSISIEFYLYILLYLTLLASVRLRHWIWLSMPLAMFGLTLTQTDLLLSPVMRGLAGFFGGAFCYHLYRRYAHAIPRSFGAATALEVTMAIGVYGVITSHLPFHSIIATLCFGLTVLVFARQSGALSALLQARLFRRGGELSYSLYLTHGAVIYAATSLGMVMQKVSGVTLLPMVGGARVFDLGSPLLNHAGAALTIGTVILLSRWTYRYIEVPGQRWGRQRAKQHTTRPGFSSAESGHCRPQSSSAGHRPTSEPA